MGHIAMRSLRIKVVKEEWCLHSFSNERAPNTCSLIYRVSSEVDKHSGVNTIESTRVSWNLNVLSTPVTCYDSFDLQKCYKTYIRIKWFQIVEKFHNYFEWQHNKLYWIWVLLFKFFFSRKLVLILNLYYIGSTYSFLVLPKNFQTIHQGKIMATMIQKSAEPRW